MKNTLSLSKVFGLVFSVFFFIFTPLAFVHAATVISSCGAITTGGNYILNGDLTSAGSCLTISALDNSVLEGVHLDCNGHNVTNTYAGSIPAHSWSELIVFWRELASIKVKNVRNFSIKNCSILSNIQINTLFVKNASNGLMDNNTFDSGNISADNSNDLTFTNNTVLSATYIQKYTSNSLIANNRFSRSMARGGAQADRYNDHFALDISGLIVLNNGSNNRVINNVLNGGALGDFNNREGMDDGIIPSDESNDLIVGNRIENFYDTGIETLGLIKDTTIANNYIKNTGFSGIGGWYWSSLLNNTIVDNVIDDAPKMFHFYREWGLRTAPYNDGAIYFKNNNFTRNRLINQSLFASNNNALTNDDGLSRINGLFSSNIGSEGEMIPRADQIITGNNVFAGNDFGATPISDFFRYFRPTSMFVDGGGNTCNHVRGENSSMSYPFNCGSVTITGTVVFRVASTQDSNMVWTGPITIQYTPPTGGAPISYTANVANNVATFHDIGVGANTIKYVSGGPGSTGSFSDGRPSTGQSGYSFSNLNGSAVSGSGYIPPVTQQLTAGGTITFTFLFNTPAQGTVSTATNTHLRYTINGVRVDAPLQGGVVANYTRVVGTAPADTTTVTIGFPADVSLSAGSHGLHYMSGGPANATLSNIDGVGANSAGQISTTKTLAPNGNINFTFNFTCSSGHVPNSAGTACVTGTQTTGTTRTTGGADTRTQVATTTVATSGTGTIRIRATLNGSPVTTAAPVTFNYTSPTGVLTPNVASDVLSNYANMPVGSHRVENTATLTNGVFQNISPSSTQTLASGGEITFTFNFACSAGYIPNSAGTGCVSATATTTPSTGTIHIRASLNGVQVPSTDATQFIINYTAPGRSGQITTNTNVNYLGAVTGTYTVSYVSGAPAGYIFKDLNGNFHTNPVSQSLSAGGDITYTFNFSCAAGYIQNGSACVPSTAATQTTTTTTTGTIHIRASLNGAPVTSPHVIVFDYTSPIGVLTQNILSDVLHDYPNMPVGTHTVVYRSVNKPAVFIFQGINDNNTTNLSQALSATNNPITFTFKFDCAAGYIPHANATTADGLCTATTQIATPACTTVAKSYACLSITDAQRTQYGIPAGATSGTASYTENSCTGAIIYTGGCSVPVVACTAVPQTPVACSSIDNTLRAQYGILADASVGTLTYTKNSCTDILVYTGGCSVPAAACVNTGTSVAQTPIACSSISDTERATYGIPAGATSGTLTYTATTNSCTGAVTYAYTGGCSVPAPGTVHIRATFNGVPVSVANTTPFNVSYTSPTVSNQNFGTNTNADYPGAVVGNYTANYAGGAPVGVVFQNVTPSITQTLTAGGDITFTFNFVGPTAMSDGSRALASVASAIRQTDSSSGSGTPFGSISSTNNNTALTYTWTRDLQVGSPHVEDVFALQKALAREGVYAGEITGGFYDQTYTAVKDFQRKYDIKVTGYVGALTRSKLNTLYSM